MAIQTIVSAVCSNRDDPKKILRIKVKSDALLKTNKEIPEWIPPDGLKYGEVDVPEVGELCEIVYDETETTDRRPGETALSNPNYRWRSLPSTGVGAPRFSRTGTTPTLLPQAMAEDYPNRRGWYSRRGHVLFFGDNKDPNLQHCTFMHRMGHGVTLLPDGSVLMQAKDGSVIRIDASDSSVTVAAKDGTCLILQKESATLMSRTGDYVNVQPGLIDVVATTTVALKAAGISLQATQILLGAGADQPIAKATSIEDYLKDIVKAAFVAHVHPIASLPVVGGGGGTVSGNTGATVTVMADPPSLGSPDHLVE